LPPTAGSALIHGYNIRSQLPQIRKFLGLCPQYNALFDNLTVEEHLRFFARLKGRVFKRQEADRLLKLLELNQKRHDMAKNLSGGMKRKLCAAIALIGGSEVKIILNH
jgi:ABC-type multidrug transport system ATPase subunit